MPANPLARFRDDFPLLKRTMHGKPLIYFDSAATTQKPQIVIDAIRQFYQENYGTVHRAVYELAVLSTAAYDASRKTVQRFLNASKVEEIIFTKGTTEAVNLVASSFGKAFVQPGDEIIVSQIEHHSNIVPWQMLCEERGARLRVIPVNDRGELILEEYRKLLNSKTKLVSIGHVANSIGTINPIKTMVSLAHEVGAKVFIDGAQSAPHIPVDVQELGADFFAFSGHKVYGPTGVGVLYGKEELLNQMPPYQGGGDMIESVSFEKTTYTTLPGKFEAGTPMIAEVIGLGVALEYLMEIGLDAICRWEHELLSYAASALERVDGVRIVGNAAQKGAIISFVVEGTHPLDIGTLLDLKGVAIRTGHHCAQPTMKRFGVSSTARISFAFYNTLEEVDRCIDLLKEVILSLR